MKIGELFFWTTLHNFAGDTLRNYVTEIYNNQRIFKRKKCTFLFISLKIINVLYMDIVRIHGNL